MRLTVPVPRVAQRVTPVPRGAQQRPSEAMPVHQGNLLDTDKQTKVAEPPGQSETKTPARGQEKVWRRWSRGNPTRQRRRVRRSGPDER